jgi:hypothetical protein
MPLYLDSVTASLLLGVVLACCWLYPFMPKRKPSCKSDASQTTRPMPRCQRRCEMCLHTYRNTTRREREIAQAQKTL